jgi:predicted methyltransferase
MTSLLITLARRAAAYAAVLALAACGSAEPLDYTWIVHNSERTDEDRALDQRRHPEDLLQFYDVRPGMRVLDLSAGRGYNTELLARVVGPEGRVYAQNSPQVLTGAGKTAFEERLKKPALANVVSIVSQFDDPIPAELRNLDLVTFNFNYHDTVNLGTDRARMNRAVFQALKPGGIYIIADHSALPGSGTNATKTLHRIDEVVVRKEVEAAGFRPVASGTFLKSAGDGRDLPVFKNPLPNDEFVLKFVKP